MLRTIWGLVKLLVSIALLPPILLFNAVRKGRDKVGYMVIGRHNVHTRPAQDVLAQHGQIPGPLAFTGYGGGAYGTRGRLIIDGEGAGGSSVLTGDSTTQFDIGDGHGYFNVGFLLLRGFVRVYPFVGIGGGGSELEAEPAGSERISKSEVDVDLGSGMRAQGGIGIEFKVGWRLGVIVGVRVGYAVDLSSTTGERSEKPFVRLVLGAGWFGKPDKATAEPTTTVTTETENAGA